MAVATKRITANARALAKSAKGFGYFVISLVVLYSDVMFVGLMWNAFPGGFLTIAAVGGAFATGISIIALVIGKSHWFRPGGQLLWSWVFTFIEVGISAMNAIVAVMTAMHKPLGYLDTYMLCAPATPIIALIGWIVILYLDKERAQMHEQMEMEDDLADAEREHKRQVHAARMEVKATALEQQKEYLKQHLSSAEIQAVLSAGSYEIARGIVSEIVQRPIMPALPASAPKIIDSTAQRGPAKRIDTSPRHRAVKQLPPRRKFTPRTQAQFIDTKEVGVPSGPLAPETEKTVAIKKNQGQYVVNRKPAAKLPTND